MSACDNCSVREQAICQSLCQSDLDELSQVEVEQDGRRALLRTAPGSTIDPICRAIGITLPPVFQENPTLAAIRLTFCA